MPLSRGDKLGPHEMGQVHHARDKNLGHAARPLKEHLEQLLVQSQMAKRRPTKKRRERREE